MSNLSGHEVITTSSTVGLDYHDAHTQVCVMNADGDVLTNRRVPSLAEAVAEVIEPFGPPREVAIEACCGAAEFSEELVRFTGWNVVSADPAEVRRRKNGSDKTDKGDAAILADLSRVGYLPKVWRPDRQTRDLRHLVRFRDQLAKTRKEIRQQVRGILREERIQPTADDVQPSGKPLGRAWSKSWLEWLRSVDVPPVVRRVLNGQLKRHDEVTEQINELVAELEQLTANDTTVQTLRKQSGVGVITALTIRAEVGRFDRFRSGKQFAKYCGVTPLNRSSGKRQADAGLTKRARTNLRTIMVEAAQRLARLDDHWKEMKRKLVGRGKPASLATAAVANRWARRLWVEMVHGAELSALRGQAA